MLSHTGKRITVYEQTPLRNLPPLIMLKGRDRLGIAVTVGDIARELFERTYARMDEREKHFTGWDLEDKRRALGDAVEGAHLAGFGYIGNRPAGYAYIVPVCKDSHTYSAHFWFGRGIREAHAMRILKGFMGELGRVNLLAQIPAPYRRARAFILKAGFKYLCSLPEACYLAHKQKAYGMDCFLWNN